MSTQPHIIGIDLGKRWFHLIGLDRDGAIVLKQKLTREQLKVFAATTAPGIVAMEACCGSQDWGRVFTQAGHEVRIIPAQFVKPFVETNKNDVNDAKASAEAGAARRCGASHSRRPSSSSCRPRIGFGAASSTSARPSSINCGRCCWSMAS